MCISIGFEERFLSYVSQESHLKCLSFLCRAVSSAVGLRTQRLSEVRELFILAYREAIPEVTEPTPSALSGITGFFSKLAGSVLNGPNTTV